MERLGWAALAARGWPGQWVALAGLINEGMEEGEPWHVGGRGSLWPQGADWGHGLLWPDLLMKGWRRVSLGASGAVGRFGRKGLAGAVGRFVRTY